MPSLQITVQCGVMPWENEGEGLIGAEYVPELKDLYRIKLSCPVPLNASNPVCHRPCALCSSLFSASRNPFVLQAQSCSCLEDSPVIGIVSSVIAPVLCPIDLTHASLS